MEEVIRSSVHGGVLATGLNTEGMCFSSTQGAPWGVGLMHGDTVPSAEQRRAGSKFVSLSFPGTAPSTPQARRGSMRAGDDAGVLHTLFCSQLVRRVAAGLNPSPGNLSG